MRTATKENSEHALIATTDPFSHGRAAREVALHDEDGQTFAEYGLVLSLVVLAAVAGLSAFGNGLAARMIGAFNAVIAALS